MCLYMYVFLLIFIWKPSWTVTPVQFEDTYEIKLEADYEVQVPIPVVTIEPKQLDMEVLERGLMPVINFRITNHGLIQANKVYINAPKDGNHPFLNFEIVSSKFMGHIYRNTNIQMMHQIYAPPNASFYWIMIYTLMPHIVHDFVQVCSCTCTSVDTSNALWLCVKTLSLFTLW